MPYTSMPAWPNLSDQEIIKSRALPDDTSQPTSPTPKNAPPLRRTNKSNSGRLRKKRYVRSVMAISQQLSLRAPRTTRAMAARGRPLAELDGEAPPREDIFSG